MSAHLIAWGEALFLALLAALHIITQPQPYDPSPETPDEPQSDEPPPVEETASSTPATAPANDLPPNPTHMLETFCTAIRDFEGKPGDLNYINHNPGNFRCSPVGYLAKYGAVRCVNDFAVFPSYELGWEYLQASVLHWATLHPSWTILDFFKHYAPPSDNNPTSAYAANVAAHCGVPVSTTLRELFA